MYVCRACLKSAIVRPVPDNDDTHFDFQPGRVLAVHGSVIDIAFPPGPLPAIHDAVAIEWDRGASLITEVQQHLGPRGARSCLSAESRIANCSAGGSCAALAQSCYAQLGRANGATGSTRLLEAHSYMISQPNIRVLRGCEPQFCATSNRRAYPATQWP